MPNIKTIQDWLIAKIAELLELAPEAIDIRAPFSTFGLSSLDMVSLSGDLEEWLDQRLDPTIAYDHPTILALSRHLAQEASTAENATAGNHPRETGTEPIAVIGIGCRFPGADDPAAFWQLLHDGVDAIREVPADRWEKQAFYHPDPSVPGKAISYWGGFLDGIDLFDPFFFGIAPVEAEIMDPQQRLLLELAYEALDDAGQVRTALDGTDTGVFVGISVNEYTHLQFSDPTRITAHSGTGSALAIAANRISYFFNFRGPSIAIDTACSSSLSAVHLACQSLRNGECRMALAGGVNMILSPAHSIAFTKAGVLAPDGRCKTFDARADGYVRGEGGGIVILKPLSAALADGDPVHALILGSAMRQDGRTNGLMAPSRESQEGLLREAYRSAGVSPASVQYVEAHGTGTLLGDSMEAGALGTVVGKGRSGGPCSIGSVKTNIGHLEAAAGIAGLIKVVLSLQHRILPPSLHYQAPNPHVSFSELNLSVQQKVDSWPAVSGPAMAGVSSFGFGGTNVHMIVQEAGTAGVPEVDPKPNSTTDFALLPLSANSYESLQSLAGTFEKLLVDETIAIQDICFAAGHRRSQFDYRLALSGHSRTELREGLLAFLQGEAVPKLLFTGERTKSNPKVAFVFPGQGGQWLGMARDLLRGEPVFYAAIERIDQLIRAEYGWSLREEMKAQADEARLDEIDIIQPMLFAIQVGLTELWASWGIRPDAVVGHSMGEVAAAHVAGILSLKDALRVICGRSRLLKPLGGQGSMLVTDLSADDARSLVAEYEDAIAVAVINSPNSTVLSGDPEALGLVRDSLERQHLFCRPVNVDIASHSAQMDSLRTALLELLAGLQPQKPELPIYSTVSGSREEDAHFDASYWVDNLRQAVLFADATGRLLEDGYTTFIELGPHPVLLGAIQQTAEAAYGRLRLLPSLRREEPAREVLFHSLGALYLDGAMIDWKNLYPKGGQYVALPPLIWQRQPYWIEPRSSRAANPWQWKRTNTRHEHPLLGKRIDLAHAAKGCLWQTSLEDASLPFLKDHRVDDAVVFPAAAYVEMTLQAAKSAGLDRTHDLFGLVFKESMTLISSSPRIVQTHLSPDGPEDFSCHIYSRSHPDEDWVLHATAELKPRLLAGEWVVPAPAPPGNIRQHSELELSAEAFYAMLRSRGVEYGPHFRAVQRVWKKGRTALGQIRLPDSLQVGTGIYQIHPALLDACLQVLAVTQGDSFEHNFYLPTGCERLQLLGAPDRIRWSQVYLSSADQATDRVRADIHLLDEKEALIGILTGFQLQRTSRRIRRLLSREDTWLYHLQWQAKETCETAVKYTGEGRYWLIFADDEGIGEALAGELETAGDYAYLLPYRETMKTLANNSSVSFSELLSQRLREIPGPLHGIIHLWSLSIPPDTTHTTAVSISCSNSVLHLVQVLAGRPAGLPRLYLVTRGVQALKTGEPVAVEQSPLWGMGKVISFEFPELNCIRIDLDRDQADAASAALLFKQVTSDDREDQIAFRAAKPYVQRLFPYRVPTSHLSNVSFRADGTYLITGGLGGLGLETARWMAQGGARNLVLMGRSAPSASATRIIRQLEADGIMVVITQGDVNDRSQLDQLLEKVKENMPDLRGVFHAAGVLDDGSLLNLSPQRMAKVMLPKITGTWNLHEATLGLPLDHFVLYSSAVSVLGSPGQANYAAGSAYLDAMAHYRRQLSLPAISINWGPWAEVGLAAETLEKLGEDSASTQHLIKVIEIEKGLEMLALLLRDESPQIMILPFDLKHLIELYPTAAGMPFLAEVGGNETHVARLYARPNLQQAYLAPRNEMERRIADLWRQTLHIDRVGVHDSFFELGGDSVLAAQILSLAQKAFGIRINPQDAFQAFTIERLAEMLEAEILRQVEAMSEEEAQQLLSKHDRYDE